MQQRSTTLESLHSLPEAVVDLILHKAYQNVWYDQHKGVLRQVCRRWSTQIFLEAEAGGITITRPVVPALTRFLHTKLSHLRALTCSLEIQSLDFVQPLTSLRSLSIRVGQLTTVGPLAALSQLERVELLGGAGGHLDGIAGWDQLQSLSSLRSVHIDHPGTSECMWLEQCPEIKQVTFGQILASELPLGVLSIADLQKLAVGDFCTADLVGTMHGLRALCLEGNSEEEPYEFDVSPLCSLTGLHTLCLEDLEIGGGLHFLGSLTQLTCLSLQSSHPLWQGFEKHGAEWLAPLSNLQRLDLESTRMRDPNVEVLSHLTGLKLLNLGHNSKVKHMSVLTSLQQLEWLGLCDCERIVDQDTLPPHVVVSLEEADLTWFSEA